MPLSGFRNRCPEGYDRRGTGADAPYQALDLFDVDLLSEAVAGSDLEHRQLGRGPFRGELRRRRLGGVCLDTGVYNQTLQSRGIFAPGAAVIGCILEGRAAGCINGHRFGRHDLVLFPVGAEMDYLVPAETRWVAIQIPPSPLIEAGVDPDTLTQVAVYSGTDPANAALASLLRRLVNAENGARCPSPDGNWELTATLDALLELMRQALDPEAKRRERRPSLHAREALVRRFEKSLSDADPCNTRIAEIAAGLGVSQRTMEYAFREHLGVSPKRYLILMKLNQIQRELLKTSPELTTVAEVARRNGVRQLGRFSMEYGRQFGELPSETLRRARP